jgi:glycosyltransferase involved in cell wall biosynthesis
MATGLNQDRFRAVVISPREGGLTEWARSAGVPCYVMPPEGTSRWSLLREVGFLASVFLRERAELVHVNSPWAYSMAGLAARLTGVRGVCHVHLPLEPSTLRWSVRFGVDAVITCYQGLASDLQAGVAGRNCRVVPISNTVDIERFTPVNAHNAEARTRWRGGATHVVVIVGHLSEVKGYPAFLRAVAKLAGRYPGCRFLAVGGETACHGYEATLRAMAASLGVADRVEFLGWRNDVADVIRAADVIVQPSLLEGLPLTVLEAMACGVPVVATNVNGTPEALLDRRTGLLIEPDDSDALSEKVSMLLDNAGLRESMGRAGRDRVEQHFTLRQFLPKLENLYDEVLAS